ncbi:MAG: hypothetical protein ACHQRM_18160, partial [Bacteroidia bacterium]
MEQTESEKMDTTLSEFIPVDIDSLRARVMDYEPGFRRHLPSLFEFLGEHALNWRVINESIHRRRIEDTEEYNRKKGHHRIQLSLTEILMEAHKGNPKSLGLAIFIDNTFKSLTLRTDNLEKELLKG